MRWFPFPKYKPTTRSGECIVVTDNQDLWIATYKECDESDELEWIAESDGFRLHSVTHFCMPDPIEVEE